MQAQKLCPRCQTRADLYAKSCAHCGHVYRTDYTPTDQTQVVPAVQAPVANPLLRQPSPSGPLPVLPAGGPTPLIVPCIVCGGVDVQKVTAIVNAGTWSSRGTSVGVGLTDFSGHGMATSVMQSESRHQGASALAAMLAPPAMPTCRPSVWVDVMILLTVVATVVYLAFCVMTWEHLFLEPVGYLGFGFLLGGLIWFCVVSKRQQKEDRELHDLHYSEYVRQLARWNQLLYCARCDSAYDPIRQQAVNARNIQTLLY